MVAKSDFTAADRIDIQFACKEVCRRMSAPCESEDDEKRGSLCEVASACCGAVQVPGTAAQYGCNRGARTSPDAEEPESPRMSVTRCTELTSSRAGPHRNRDVQWRGGVLRRRERSVRGSRFCELASRLDWSPQQRACEHGLKSRHCGAPGSRKVRHLEVRTLWLQDQVDRGLIQVAKIVGQTIACIKFFDGRTLQEMLSLLPLCFTGGRHALAPQLHGQIQVLMSDECSKSQ